MNKILFSLSLMFFLPILSIPETADAVLVTPSVEVEASATVEVFANHIVTGLYRSIDLEQYMIVLDDGSVWGISITDNPIIEEFGNEFIGAYVSVMPTAGDPAKGLHRIVVHDCSYPIALEVDIVTYSKYGMRLISGIDNNVIKILNHRDGSTLDFFVSEDSLEVLSNWSLGDDILIGGIWLNEFDNQNRKIRPCTSFVIYNYSRNDFVFTYLP